MNHLVGRWQSRPFHREKFFSRGNVLFVFTSKVVKNIHTERYCKYNAAHPFSLWVPFSTSCKISTPGKYSGRRNAIRQNPERHPKLVVEPPGYPIRISMQPNQIIQINVITITRHTNAAPILLSSDTREELKGHNQHTFSFGRSVGIG